MTLYRRWLLRLDSNSVAGYGGVARLRQGYGAPSQQPPLNKAGGAYVG